MLQLPALPSRMLDARVGARLRQGLVSYWPLDEVSGTRRDAFGTNHLTDNNTVTQADGPSLYLPKAADFELDNSESLSITSNSTIQVGDIAFTLFGWAKLESLPVGMHYDMLSKWDSGANSREFLVRVNDGTTALRFLVSPDGSGTGLGQVVDTAVTLDTTNGFFWYIQHNPTTNQLLISINNHTPITTSYSTGVHTGTAIFAFGASHNNNAPGSFFDGIQSGVGFWKRAVSAEELAWLYNRGLGRSWPWQ